MAFPVYDNIYLSAPLPLDARYLVSAEIELNSGNVYVSMQRFSLKENTLWIRLSTGWRKIPLDASITAGTPGKDGLAATIEIGSVQESATMKVENAGTANAAKLNFFLMRGLPGAPGQDGESIEGPQGPKGDNFSIEQMGTFADRSLYDQYPEFTAYLVDQVGHVDHGCLYFKKAGDGLWSDPIPFKGEQGWALELGVVNVNENIVVHSAAKWVGGRGAIPFSLTEQAYYLGPNGFTTNLAEATNIKGLQGDPGPPGESVAGPPGKEGPQGKAGLSLYFAYADNAAGTNASVTYDELKTHISLVQAAAAPALGSFQIWNRFKGEQGLSGQDGKSIYFAYANASDGTGATWEYANHAFVSFLSANQQPADFAPFTTWLPLGGGGAVFPLYVADTAYSEGSDVRYLSEGKYLLFTRSNVNPGLKIDPVTSTDAESGEWVQIGGAGNKLANTDEIETEGAVNKWWTNLRSITATLTGYVKATTFSAITAADTVMAAIAKLELKLDELLARFWEIETEYAFLGATEAISSYSFAVEFTYIDGGTALGNVQISVDGAAYTPLVTGFLVPAAKRFKLKPTYLTATTEGVLITRVKKQ